MLLRLFCAGLKFQLNNIFFSNTKELNNFLDYFQTGTKIIGIIYIIIGLFSFFSIFVSLLALLYSIPLILVGICSLLATVFKHKTFALLAFVFMVNLKKNKFFKIDGEYENTRIFQIIFLVILLLIVKIVVLGCYVSFGIDFYQCISTSYLKSIPTDMESGNKCFNQFFHS